MTEPRRYPPEIDGAVFDRVVAGVRNGKYHLLLGAGASFGCSNSEGELPLAAALEARLFRAMGVEPQGVGLPRAFEAAVATLGLDDVVALLRRLYSGAEPSAWHTLIPLLTWEAIWTFNIDDVAEHAYDRVEQRRQIAITRVWGDDLLPYGGGHEQVPLVHLHGYVGAIDERQDPQLVFDWQQYLDAVRNAARGSWLSNFRSNYQTLPCIILGARLSDELDVFDVVRQGNHSARYGLPSVVVRPGITDFERAEYERFGLVAVSMTADDFFRYVVDAVQVEAERRDEDAFSSQYTDRTFLPLSRADASATEGHDFYGGHDPQWFDIVSKLDAVPRWSLDLVDEIGAPDDFASVQRLYLLQGPPFCGKSTALLRVASDLAGRGWEPVLLVGRDRIEYDQTLDYFRSRPNALLVIDGVRDDAGNVGELLRRAEASNQRLVVVAAERQRHVPHVVNVVSPRHLIGVETTLFVEPTSALWMAIIEKRAERARVGRLEGASDRDRARHFVSHGRELFSALASLEDAAGFIDRGIDVYRSLQPDLQTAFAATGLLGWFDLPAPLATVSAASGASVRRLIEATAPGGELAQWMVADQRDVGCVRLRHRYIGDLLLSDRADALHRVRLREVAQNICLALADQVAPKTIRRRTLAHRIVRSLMDLETVRMLCHTGDVDDWYDDMEAAYEGIARYWEQRALGLTALDRAYSYSKRAVALHADAFTLNTLGTVLMRRAVEDGIGPAQRKSYWREGLDALAASRDRGDGRFEHPFITFFTYTLRVMAREPNMDADWFVKAEQAFRDWRDEAARLSFFDSQVMRRIVSDFPADWRR